MQGFLQGVLLLDRAEIAVNEGILNRAVQLLVDPVVQIREPLRITRVLFGLGSRIQYYTAALRFSTAQLALLDGASLGGEETEDLEADGEYQQYMMTLLLHFRLLLENNDLVQAWNFQRSIRPSLQLALQRKFLLIFFYYCIQSNFSFLFCLCV